MKKRAKIKAKVGRIPKQAFLKKRKKQQRDERKMAQHIFDIDHMSMTDD